MVVKHRAGSTPAPGTRNLMTFLKNRKLLKQVSGRYNQDLSGVILIGCQHILGTTVDLLNELIRNGLKESNIFLIGKCYSTNLKTYNRIKKLGIYIDESSRSFISQEAFDHQFRKYVGSFLNNVLGKISKIKDKRIIVLDDGGQLIELFNKKNLKHFRRTGAVEQTTSGYEKIKKLNLKFPVINVARSNAKLEFESPIIAEIVVKNIGQYFKKNKIFNPKVLIVGKGYVGDKIMNLLSKNYDVDSYDLISHNEPFPSAFASKLHGYKVIIGVTGKNILSKEKYKLLSKGAHLISASSSDREFEAWNSRGGLSENNCHRDIQEEQITIANSGFPINFTGQKHSVPPSKIMLTRALLLAGIYEANKKSHDKGLVDLSQAIQIFILNNYKR